MNRFYRGFVLCMMGVLFVTASARAADQDNLQLASQVVALQVGEDAKVKAGDTLATMVAPLVVRENPGQEQQIAAIADKTIKPAMATGADNIARQTADLLSQSFSKEELEQLLAFQSSPVGMKYKKFYSDNGQKLKDIAKTESSSKAQDGIRQFVIQLKMAGLRAPKELDR